MSMAASFFKIPHFWGNQMRLHLIIKNTGRKRERKKGSGIKKKERKKERNKERKKQEETEKERKDQE